MAKTPRTSWFIIRGEKRFGPFTSDDLREYVAQGRLTADDLLWKEGLAEPVKAGKVGKLGLDSGSVLAKPVVVEMPPELNSAVIDISKLAKKPAVENADAWDILNEEAVSGPTAKPKKAKQKLNEDVGAGGAIVQATSRGFAALGEFFSHPLRHSFLLLVLLISCSLAAVPLLTLILVPAFFIGYITCMDGMLGGEKASITKFLSFLRHGWDSLWHLLMMQAALLILLAMAIAPAVIAGMFFVATFGSATLGMIEVASHVSFPEAKRGPDKQEGPKQQPAGRPDARKDLPKNRIPDDLPDFGEPEPDRINRGAGRPPVAKAEGPGLFDGLLEGVFSLGQTVVSILMIIVVGAVGCLVLTPLASAMVLAFCLVYKVALGTGANEQKFDLVYNALESTIQVATGAWGRILASGLWICGLPLLLYVLNIIVGLVFAKLGLYFLSMWVGTIVTPIFSFLLMGHLGIFLVMTARDLSAAVK